MMWRWPRKRFRPIVKPKSITYGVVRTHTRYIPGTGAQVIQLHKSTYNNKYYKYMQVHSSTYAKQCRPHATYTGGTQQQSITPDETPTAPFCCWTPCRPKPKPRLLWTAAAPETPQKGEFVPHMCHVRRLGICTSLVDYSPRQKKYILKIPTTEPFREYCDGACEN